MANDRDTDAGQSGTTGRDRYRDNDDMRDQLTGDERTGTSPDPKAEARGDARETVGNNARGTAANPRGPEGNDRNQNRPREDSYDEDLARDKRKARE
jgi:hypothetical protein